MAGFEEIHGFVVAGAAVLASVVVNPLQIVNVPVIIGRAMTVTVAVATQPFELVYVIIAVPAVFPVTTPALLIVATAVLEETQALIAAGADGLDNVVVNPAQTVSVPLITGSGLTVTVAVITQPLEFVKVMTAVPTAFPVTTPVLFTDATVASDDVQGFTVAGAAALASVVVNPWQTFSVPVMVGNATTVTVAVAKHPLEFVKVMTAVPGAFPVTTPALFTEATAAFEELQGVTLGVAVVANVVVKPLQTVNVPVITGIAMTVTVAVAVQPFTSV